MKLALRRLRDQPSIVRYAVECAVLLLMVVAPLVTFLILSGRFDDPGPMFLGDVLGAVGAERTTRFAQILQRVNPYLPDVLMAWFVVASLLSLRQLLVLIGLIRLVRRNTSSLGKDSHSLKQLVVEMGIRRPVRILESRLVDVPATVGWLRPLVLLPAAAITGLPPEYLRAVVVHELSHIRRHDYFVNIIQSFAETLLFFHPAVWWVSSQIRKERENCCDDDAIRFCGDSALYGRALFELELKRSKLGQFALTATGVG